MSEVTHPARLSPAEQAKQQFWQFEALTKAARAAKLGEAFEARRRERPDDSANGILTWLTEGQEVSPGALYNLLYLHRAQTAGFLAGSLMYLYAVGYLLHQTVKPPAELELMDPEAVKQLAADHKRGTRGANAAALAPAQQATRDALTANVPDAPRHPVEQDALNLEALSVIEAKLPAVYRAAVHAAQTGEVDALDELGEAVRPMGKRAWLKQFGRCRVCGEVARPGEILDLHHEQLGEREARPNNDAPEVLSAVHRACHIPAPFSDRVTIHSRALSVGNDPARLVALLEHLASEDERYEKYIRG